MLITVENIFERFLEINLDFAPSHRLRQNIGFAKFIASKALKLFSTRILMVINSLQKANLSTMAVINAMFINV